MRIWRTSPTLFMLLLVTFGLFLMHALGYRGPAHPPVAHGPDTGTTVTVFTDLPGEPGAPMGMGGVSGWSTATTPITPRPG